VEMKQCVLTSIPFDPSFGVARSRAAFVFKC
jgi:hypothetical protein